MTHRLPPLENIQAFIEGARGPSFRAAADRCAISPAAFSRRLQGFASQMDLVLFERSKDGLKLTEAGQRCLRELEPAYVELRRAARAAVGERADDDRNVRLSLSHSLAVGWLIPRLPDLARIEPEIRLSLETVRDDSALRRGGVDLALCYSDIDVSGLSVRRLLEIKGTPAASPAFARVYHANPDLAAHARLAVSTPAHQWEWWTEKAGLPSLGATCQFDIMHAAYEAAAQGMGIVMASTPTVQPYLDDGRLAPLGLPWLTYPGGYTLATTMAGRRRPDIAAVWRWLESQAIVDRSVEKVVGLAERRAIQPADSSRFRVSVENASLSRSASL